MSQSKTTNFSCPICGKQSPGGNPPPCKECYSKYGEKQRCTAGSTPASPPLTTKFIKWFDAQTWTWPTLIFGTAVIIRILQ